LGHYSCRRTDAALFMWGDAHRPINVRSVRKSILSGLYGATSVEKPNVNDTAQNPTVVGTFTDPSSVPIHSSIIGTLRGDFCDYHQGPA
jgi:hypothetical protein